MTEYEHYSVLLEEAIEGLAIKPNGIYVDCTLGGGGHSLKILEKLNEEGHLYAFDQDRVAIENAERELATYIEKGQVTLIKSNFRNLREELENRSITSVDGILYDLGVSSPQLDEAERGFSYRFDATLDMRMDQDQELTAYTIVNEWSYEKLVKIFYRYGEENFRSKLRVELSVFVKTSQSRQQVNLLISSVIVSQQLLEERVDTQANGFSKLYELL